MTSTNHLRVLIVAHSFPPMNAIASHRPYSWAKEWSEQGHEVHVLTPAKHSFDGDMGLVRDMAGIHVHEVPYLPLRSVSKNEGSSRLSTRRVERWEWIKTVTRRARFSLAMFGDPRLLAYFPLVREGLKIVRTHNIGLIVATSPPEVVFFTARSLSRRTGVPWIADFRDLWFRDMRLYQSHLASWLSGPLNRWLVRSASALVTVSRGLQDRLSSYMGREVVVSYNGFFENEHKTASPESPWTDNKLHIVYTGRLYPAKRNPESLFKALSALRANTVDLADRITVDFYGFDDPWLHTLIDRYSVNDCVTMHGFIPYRESVRVQCAADVLLFLDWMDTQAEGVLTGKLFEYLGSGRPILALGARNDSEAARLITESHCGVTLTRQETIVPYLEQLLTSGRQPSIAHENTLQFSRNRQARTLLAEIKNRLP